MLHFSTAPASEGPPPEAAATGCGPPPSPAARPDPRPDPRPGASGERRGRWETLRLALYVNMNVEKYAVRV
jgi:hypothetical protein